MSSFSLFDAEENDTVETIPQKLTRERCNLIRYFHNFRDIQQSLAVSQDTAGAFWLISRPMRKAYYKEVMLKMPASVRLAMLTNDGTVKYLGGLFVTVVCVAIYEAFGCCSERQDI